MGDLRELLTSIVGEWSGQYRLWLQPGELTSESATSAVVTPVLDGRFLRITYDWSVEEDQQHGEYLVGAPGDARLTASWVDSWHNGDEIMFCRSDGTTVLGEYGPAEEPWGWRTAFERRGDGELVITAWNISPAGDEAMATEARYRR